LVIEIVPIRVGLLDQSDLPGSIPALETLFPANCSFNVHMRLEINKAMNCILLCETAHCLRTMFIDATHKIVGHTDIERAAELAGKNIDPIITFCARSRRSVVTGSSAFADDDR